MDTLSTYREAVERVLTEYARFLMSDEISVCETVFDREHDRYLLVEVGWEDGYRVYGTLLHVDLIDGKLWISMTAPRKALPARWSPPASQKNISYWPSVPRPCAGTQSSPPPSPRAAPSYRVAIARLADGSGLEAVH